MADPRLDVNGELRPADHVVRYCGLQKLRPDGTPSNAAFLPDADGYVSVFWLEFAGIADDIARWEDLRTRMRASNVTLGAKGKLAKLPVGLVKTEVRTQLQRELSIRHMPVLNDGRAEPDASHCGIHGIPHDPLDTADLIAELVADLRPAKV